MVSLNELNVQDSDTSNAYLFVKCRDKVYLIAGNKFGEKM